jgi:DNA polymerase/3'-5' exonuclease PolX
MNSLIISELNKLISTLLYEKPPNFSFKVNSFKKTINLIKDLDFEINSTEQLKNVKGIGKGTLERITEILKNGNLKENKNVEKKQKNISDFSKLQTITGIGPAKAKQLIQKNISFDDLINNPTETMLSELTHHQLIGVKYYHDILKRIDNNIISNIEQYLKKFNFKFNICGSYRRKKETSGDIDILILEEKKSLKDIVNDLTKDKFIIDNLTDDGKTKYMGICKTSKSHAMRIDIRLIPKISYPFALLYFTGSKKTNTYMRNIAIKAGYKLSEYGLYDKDSNFISLNTEKDIFEFLHLPYILPEKR